MFSDEYNSRLTVQMLWKIENYYENCYVYNVTIQKRKKKKPSHQNKPQP